MEGEDKVPSLDPPAGEDLAGLSGQTVLVTGGGSGIGRAMVAAFHAAGARVIAADLRTDAVTETVRSIGPSDRLEAHTVDVADPESVDALAAAVGAVDVLCNNAGVFDEFRRLHDTGYDLWQRVNAVNVTGPFLMSASFLGPMIEKGQGVILNTASSAAFGAGCGGAAYTASKHAVLGLTRDIAFSYGGDGVRANAICPGVVATDMANNFPEWSLHAAQMPEKTPINRWATPEEIAHVAVFLAGPAASFISGAAVPVDGGAGAS